MISLYNAGARDITVPNAVVGMAIFCGGLTQLLAGMWEFPHGDTFAATGMFFNTQLVVLFYKRSTLYSPITSRYSILLIRCLLDVVRYHHDSRIRNCIVVS